jgi:NADH dehydrogenase FAD-containing subunit
LINEVDNEIKTLPTTAQAASQAGRYLAMLFGFNLISAKILF